MLSVPSFIMFITHGVIPIQNNTLHFNHHLGTHIVGRDGCLVQPGKTYRQIGSFRRNPTPHLSGDQGRGEGGTIPRPVHMSA